MTQTKINTTLGFTAQLNLLFKPTPIPCLFLVRKLVPRVTIFREPMRKLAKTKTNRSFNRVENATWPP